MGDLRYCFEQSSVPSTLLKTSKSGLAVIDTDGISRSAIQSAALGTIYKSRNMRYYKHTDKYIHKEIIL